MPTNHQVALQVDLSAAIEGDGRLVYDVIRVRVVARPVTGRGRLYLAKSGNGTIGSDGNSLLASSLIAQPVAVAIPHCTHGAEQGA